MKCVYICAVRLFCSILAIIMLVLSCIPCSDAEIFATSNQQSHTVKNDGNSSHSSDQEHKDLCSPFCQCSCCAVAYALPSSAIPKIEIRVAISEKAFAFYSQHRPEGISLPVWQPPQLV